MTPEQERLWSWQRSEQNPHRKKWQEAVTDMEHMARSTPDFEDKAETFARLRTKYPNGPKPEDLRILERELKCEKARQAFFQQMQDAKHEVRQWIVQTNKPVLEKNDCSRLHKMVGSFIKMQAAMRHVEPETEEAGSDPVDWKEFQPFVVQHDWAKAFANTDGLTDDGMYQLPYEHCAFEFRVSGKNIVIMVHADNGEIKGSTVVMIEASNGFWINPNVQLANTPIVLLLCRNIQAICVGLEAEVATHSVVRQSERVNRHRIQRGKVPFYSYHVVSLAPKSRVEDSPHVDTGTQKRLHFRRGHWRHFSNYRTWVKWTLAGNPDLGFVDKEYRL